MKHLHLDIDIDRLSTTTVVTVRGELDLATAGRLDSALDTLTAEDVVLDLRPLTYLDSTGVRLLVRRDAAAPSGGRRLSLRRGARAAPLFVLAQTGAVLRPA